MISGTFQVGETITGTMRPVGNVSASEGDPSITFRAAQANHKAGAFDNATEVFTLLVRTTIVKLFQVHIHQRLPF